MHKFNFNAIVEKAYEKDGDWYIMAIASDNLEDRHGDEMSESALKKMALYAKKGIPLRRTHSDAFEIGFSTKGKVRENGDQYQFLVEIKLDKSFPESRILFEEIKSNKAARQLSIGGFINPHNSKAVSFKDAGNGKLVRVIRDIELNHIAVTAPDMAANPRTGFIDTIIKSLEVLDNQIGLTIDKAKEVEYSQEKLSKETNVQETVQEVNKDEIPYKKLPMADKDSEWSFSANDGDALLIKGSGLNSMEEFNKASESIQKDGWILYKSAHVYFDTEEDAEHKDVPFKKSAYGLPIAKLVDNELKIFFRALVAAMAALHGARGGFKRAKSEEERKKIHDILAKHMKEFGAEPPEFKDYNEKEFIEFFDKNKIDLSWLFKENIMSEAPNIEKVDVAYSESDSTLDKSKTINKFFQAINNMVVKEDKKEETIVNKESEPVKEAKEVSTNQFDVKKESIEKELIEKGYHDEEYMCEYAKMMGIEFEMCLRKYHRLYGEMPEGSDEVIGNLMKLKEELMPMSMEKSEKSIEIEQDNISLIKNILEKSSEEEKEQIRNIFSSYFNLSNKLYSKQEGNNMSEQNKEVKEVVKEEVSKEISKETSKNEIKEMLEVIKNLSSELNKSNARLENLEKKNYSGNAMPLIEEEKNKSVFNGILFKKKR